MKNSKKREKETSAESLMLLQLSQLLSTCQSSLCITLLLLPPTFTP